MAVLRTDAQEVSRNVSDLSEAFAKDRYGRQRRRYLDPADFARLREAGFLRTGVPKEYGGLVQSVPRSSRTVAEMLRTLAHGDSSVALVAAMHPAVLYAGAWLFVEEAPPPHREAWEQQREWVFESALDGHWWGTITSEPGSGGDILRTKAVARKRGPHGNYLLTGQKHFGSGSGVTSFMVTTAVPEGEDAPDWFILDMRNIPWDGTAGVKLTAEWDGHGMTSTQSHGMDFSDFPATRSAYPGFLARELSGPGGFIPCLFTAVIVGIVEVACDTARKKLEPVVDALGAYEQVEWTRVQQELWLIQQAYEGMLRATEERDGEHTLRGKTAVAELAESLMTRLCRIMGGGSYARHSPFGFWFEDVRALGFLRPPWGLAYRTLHGLSWTG